MEGYKMNTLEKNILDPNLKSQAIEARVLNVLIYLDIDWIKARDGHYTLRQIVNELSKFYDSPKGYERFREEYLKESAVLGRKVDSEDAIEDEYEGRQRMYRVVKNASESPESKGHLANMTIGNQSWEMGYDQKGLNACTFTDTDGKVIVVYRGTGSGEWIDNSKGLSGLETETKQQKEALEYFEKVVERNGYNESNQITISGHSKGGNKAQYTTVNSKYRNIINKCFNFDGQGFSPEAIKKFKKYSDYNQSIHKMYGFNGGNDFVNVMGNTIIPEENRFYFQTHIPINIPTDIDGLEDVMSYIKNKENLGDIKKFHFPDSCIREDGSFGEQVEQGAISKFTERFSKNTVILPPYQRAKVYNAIMGLMQGDNETVNGDEVSWLDKAVAIISVPTLVDFMGGAALGTIKEDGGAIPELVSALVLASICPKLFADDLAKVALNDFVAVVGIAIENIKKLWAFIIDKLVQFGNWIIKVADEIGKAFWKFVDGVKLAWDKLQNFIVGLYNEIIATGKAVVAAIDRFKDKATAAIAKFFTCLANGLKKYYSAAKNTVVTAWDKAVDRATKNVNTIVNTTRTEIKKQYQNFKTGSNYLINYSKKTIANYGAKGVNILKKFGKKVIRGMVTYTHSQLSVDLIRLQDLQNKLKSMERNFGEKIQRILSESNKANSDVERRYDEYYVRQQIQSVNMSCYQIKERGRRVCDALERKANSLKYVLGHYKAVENMLSREISEFN